jgi:hypothetical protein
MQSDSAITRRAFAILPQDADNFAGGILAGLRRALYFCIADKFHGRGFRSISLCSVNPCSGLSRYNPQHG